MKIGRETCLKQMAAQLGRHVNYLYAMRSLGFSGNSVSAARKWIQAQGFVIRRGQPHLKYDTKKEATPR